MVTNDLLEQTSRITRGHVLLSRFRQEERKIMLTFKNLSSPLSYLSFKNELTHELDVFNSL